MRTRIHLTTALACALALLVLVAGCSGDEEEPAPESVTTPTEGAAATDAVEIADFEFKPPTITVDAGSEVIWSNNDPAAHTASAKDGSFDTGAMNKGDEGMVSFDEPGTYAYICEFHPFMKGTVEVE